MDQNTSRSANQTLPAGTDADDSLNGRLAPVRCAICRKRIWSNALILKEPAEAPEPQQEWRLCKACYAAVMAQLEQSTLRTPVRMRVVVGLVAAERWPRARTRNLGKQREDHIWIAVLGWGFVGMMLLHLVIIILLANIAK